LIKEITKNLDMYFVRLEGILVITIMVIQIIIHTKSAHVGNINYYY